MGKKSYWDKNKENGRRTKFTAPRTAPHVEGDTTTKEFLSLNSGKSKASLTSGI